MEGREHKAKAGWRWPWVNLSVEKGRAGHCILQPMATPPATAIGEGRGSMSTKHGLQELVNSGGLEKELPVMLWVFVS